MGRWTPLILMAGGLAILVGTLIGTLFPMNGQNAQAPNQGPNRASSVLPANINVNSTATGSAPTTENGANVAQNNNTAQNDTTGGTTGGEANIDQNQPTEPSSSGSTDSNSNNSPIRALW